MSTSSKVEIASRAPEPTVDRIEELAGRILRGDILLPKFQRDFVWESRQILDLLDSIVNNYPIGSVLLWRTNSKLRSERNIADLEIAPTAVKANLISAAAFEAAKRDDYEMFLLERANTINNRVST
jgi:hypothetical protein